MKKFFHGVALFVVATCACASGISPALTHPGILVGNEQLEIVRRHISEGSPLALSALAKARDSDLGSLDYIPHAWATVECGPYSKPDYGCTDEWRDAQAAYTHALLWAYLGDVRHARKAIDIMNAWSGTLRGGHTNTNAPLQASWSAQLWPRAAEIVRYTSGEWRDNDIDAFSRMLREQYLPDIARMGRCNEFNWQTSAIEARANIAIFLNDRRAFDEAVNLWRERIKTSIYLPKDGVVPLTSAMCPKVGDELIASWYGQSVFVAGHAKETCRDLEHNAYGIAGLINVAETARIQGIDLYGEEPERLIAAMEYHAGLKNADVPAWVCGGVVKGDLSGTFEIGYNHYVNRLGARLPETSRWLPARRPTHGQFHYLWETLTHAETGTAQ
ncbi:alginate lyase [Luteibacter rhizovicinus]|uniref:Alginate lyase n=1 Tax=Luteibacter rhizovicinus TaxID=242606 RepID=A0A4R3YMD3_9GAMM|nr:alginate lyase family protein [Luteibacter rhizovicinus]TCV93965.1 alginate lyase [Luteibacter rhizovicinus]